MTFDSNALFAAFNSCTPNEGRMPLEVCAVEENIRFLRLIVCPHDV